MTEGERLKLLVDCLCGGSQAKFSRLTKFNRTSLNKLIKGKAKEIGLSLSEEHIAKIRKAFPCVSEDFLRTGEGYPGDITIDLTRRRYKALLANKDKKIESLQVELERANKIIEALLKQKGEK